MVRPACRTTRAWACGALRAFCWRTTAGLSRSEPNPGKTHLFPRFDFNRRSTALSSRAYGSFHKIDRVPLHHWSVEGSALEDVIASQRSQLSRRSESRREVCPSADKKSENNRAVSRALCRRKEHVVRPVEIEDRGWDKPLQNSAWKRGHYY